MVRKNLFTDVQVSRYNVGVWQKSDSGNVFMVSREVEKPSPHGEPDVGKLVLLELDTDGKVISEKVVWEPVGDSLWLEDPRALSLPDGSVVIGLTAVLRERLGYKPYPALTRLKTRDWQEVLPAVTLVESLGPAKNVTPLDGHIFLCRPERLEYFHKLLVFSFEDLLARVVQDLEFPTNLKWADWKIGTSMPPLWLDEHRAVMIFHGIAQVDGKYIYSLGRAILERAGDKFSLRCSPEPIITPDDFVDDQGQPLVKELHPEVRRVVYSCGGIVKHGQKEKLSLYVNVGDRTTFEVEFALSELTQGLL